jgi:uncharacterized protein (DUF58 family)
MPTDAGNGPVQRWLDPDAMARLSGLHLSSRHLTDGYRTGLSRSARRGASAEFSEHRQYAAGDDPRYVDWKAYAKSDRYYVKQFHDETNRVVTVLLDASLSMDYRSDLTGATKFDVARELTALLSWVVLRQGDAAGLAVFDGEVREVLRAANHAQQLPELCRLLDTLSAKGTSGVCQALGALSERLPRRGLIVVVSDLFDDPANLNSALRQLTARGHDAILLHVIDRAEEEFPFEEPTRFLGIEDGGDIPCDARAIARQYRAEFVRFLTDLQRLARDHGVQYAVARTDRSPANSLFECLVRRTTGRA